MPTCAVCTCKNDDKTILSEVTNVKPILHRFPKDEEMCKKWINLCKRKDPINSNAARICSDHFLASDYERNLMAELLQVPPARRKLKPDAFPSLHLPGRINKFEPSPSQTRLENRERRKLVADYAQPIHDSMRRKRRKLNTHEGTVDENQVPNIASHTELRPSLEVQEEHANVNLPNQENIENEPPQPCQSPNSAATTERNGVTPLRAIQPFPTTPTHRGNVTIIRPIIIQNKSSSEDASLWKKMYEDQAVTIKSLRDQLQVKDTELSDLKRKHRLKILRLTTQKHQESKRANKLEKERDQFEKALQSVFSEAQIAKLMNKRVPFGNEDFQKALALSTISPKAYRLIRSYNVPFPAESTVKNHLSKCKIVPGIITPVLSILKEEAKVMSTNDKLCVLAFDEMSVRSKWEWDRSSDTIYPPFSKVQVAMISGIYKKWHQPIFYDFDTKMTKNVLFKILDAVKDAGFIVKAMTCDLGPDNVALHNSLEVGHDKNSSFFHQNNEIHVLADMPHMMKLLRNHLIDDGLWMSSLKDKKVDKETLEKMIEKDNYEIKLCPKLTLSKINVRGSERMRVAPAVQIFSTHTAALARLVFKDEPFVSEFFQEIDDLFDIFNSRIPEDRDKPIRSGFGLKFNDQMARLDKIQTTILEIRSGTRNTLLPCQKGILMSITSLKKLHDDLQNNYGISYILTRRLNQDPLESLFSVIRALGRTYDHPSAVSFNYRIKAILFGSKLRPPISCNVEFKDTFATFITSSMLKFGISKKFQETIDNGTDDFVTDLLEKEKDVDEHEYEFKEDAVHFIAGYVAAALKRKKQEIHGKITRRAIRSEANKSLWVYQLSRGGLVVPTEELYENVKRLNEIFDRGFSLKTIQRKPNISSKIFAVLKRFCPDISDNILHEFVKVRKNIRVKNARMTIPTVFYASRTQRNVKKAKQFVQSNKKQIENVK